jgi:hypothetical protein
VGVSSRREGDEMMGDVVAPVPQIDGQRRREAAGLEGCGERTRRYDEKGMMRGLHFHERWSGSGRSMWTVWTDHL